MHELAQYLPTLKSLWTVWFSAMFVGLIAWALWPSRRAELKHAARIPLEDDHVG